MGGSAKATSLRDEFASEMAIRLPAQLQTLSFGASGEADILLSNTVAAASDDNVLFVRFATVDSLQKDILGNAQNVFTPHVAQVAIEANTEVTGDGGAVSYWTNVLAVIGSLVSKGIRVELFLETDGTPPTVSTLAIAKRKAVFENTTQYPLMASM